MSLISQVVCAISNLHVLRAHWCHLYIFETELMVPVVADTSSISRTQKDRNVNRSISVGAHNLMY